MEAIKLYEAYKPKKNYKVIVKTITFNQSKYIQDTLNGVSMQKTTFPFVNIVLEDNSADGEQEVIKLWLERECDMSLAEYFDIPTADLIIVPHKTNLNCTFAIYFHKENLFQQKTKREEQVDPWRIKSEYEALCEGDDYWIDPLKLQKQVDFLEANPEYVLVHSDFIALNDSTGQKIYNASSRYSINNGDVFEKLFQGCFIRTPSVCYRIINLELTISDLPSNTFAGDMFLFYNLASKGKFYFMEEEMCVYRVLQKSASHPCSEVARKTIWQRYKNLDYFIARHFKVDDSIILKLNYKWFRIDLRNCIATKDYEEFNRLTIPGKDISLIYKVLYYCCRSRLVMCLSSTILKLKSELMNNKWF